MQMHENESPSLPRNGLTVTSQGVRETKARVQVPLSQQGLSHL